MLAGNHRVAVVTGAAKGIGFAIAKRFADQDYCVAMLDIDEALVGESAKLLDGQEQRVLSVFCDVSDVDSISRAVDAVASKFGGIDVVVNNAGILFSTPIPEVTEKEWDRVLAVNLKSMFFTMQKALPWLKKSAAPRIINISSLAGRMGGYEVGLSYSASKGGAISLTMGLARQLAPFGVTVNVVCPSTTESDIIRQWSQAQIDRLRDRCPLGRLGKPEDIAAAVCFLASEEAGYITGAILDVNGGTHMG